MRVRSLALLRGLRIRRCCELCGVGHRCGSDPTLLWLWLRPATTALIRPIAWEPPQAEGVALEKTKTSKQTNKNLIGIHEDVGSIPRLAQ